MVGKMLGSVLENAGILWLSWEKLKILLDSEFAAKGILCREVGWN